jgi:hypothetical protein
MDKQLQSKAIDIKGKQYVLVSDRVLAFNEMYPNGSIIAELLSDTDSEIIYMKAVVTPDVDKPTRVFAGHSQAKWGDGYINKTSALENCETSAVGRALGMMGIGVIESIASVDETNKANTSKPVDIKKTLEHAVAMLEKESSTNTPEDTQLMLERIQKGKKRVEKYPDLHARLHSLEIKLKS